VSRLALRHQLLAVISWALACLGIGLARAASPDATVREAADRHALRKAVGTLREVPLRHVQRVNMAEKDGWWAQYGV
jgi:hypothetical protein